MNQGGKNRVNRVTVCDSTDSELEADVAYLVNLVTLSSTTYAYNPWNGLVSAVTNGVGLVAEYQYDVMDRPTNIVWRAPGGGVLASFRYAYNALGMVTGRAKSVGTNEVATAYGYDDLDRLASETESTGASRTYGYDLAGNRLFKTQTGSATIAYSLGVGDRLATYTGGSYTHAAAGCVTSIDRTGKPDLALTWNGQYQLTSVSTNGVVAESYAYDPLGRRASTTSGGVTFRHVYDGVHCAADIDSAGALVRSYTWGPGVDNLLAVTCHSGSSSTTYYALTDVQGTVYGFADANGDLVARYAYDAWGNLLDADVAVSDLADNRYLFQGREYSHATGLYNFRLRWYDPATGRWLSKDPIGISGGLNLYAFCGNDPVNYMDPWGLFWREAGSVALGTFSGAVSGAATGATSGATIGAIIGGTTGSVVFPGVGTGVGVGGGAVVGAGGGAIMGAAAGALGGFVASLGAALADGDLGDVAEAGASAGALSGIGAGAGAIGGVAAGAFGGAIAGGISGGIASEGYLNTILYCGAVGGVWSGIGGGSPGMYPAFFSATGEIWGYDLCWLIELYDNDCE